MIKKIFSYMLCFSLFVFAVFTFSACKTNVTNFSVSSVKSNGGLGVVVGETLYYVNRVVSDRTLTGKDCDPVGIYSTSVDGNGMRTGEAQLVYSALAGFSDGQLFAFGDYIYFATPANITSSSAQRLTSRASFCRVRFDGSDYRVLYTTKTTATPSYQYYTDGEKLCLWVYEDKTLTNVSIGKKMVAEVVDTEVSSVIFSENCGQDGEIDKYVFYTKEPTQDFITQKGHNVYRVLGTDTQAKLISSGKDVAIVRLFNGYLYYTMDGKTLYRTQDANALGDQNVVCYGMADLKKYFCTKDGGIVVATSNSVWYYNWSSGSLVSRKLVSDSADFEFICEYNGNLYMKKSKSGEKMNMVKVSLLSGGLTDVTTTEISKAGIYMNYEIIGSTLYYYESVTEVDEAGKDNKYSALRYVEA